MKGILLSEFIEYLETRFGEIETQQIIENADLPSNGSYSRVGMYGYQELIKLLSDAASSTGKDSEIILNEYTDHLFAVFQKDYSTFFQDAKNAIDMLKTIDDHIHIEVKKLYPDAELPEFSYKEANDKLYLYYVSPRPLATVANALINACLKHFGNQEQLLKAELASDHKSATFIIHKI